MKLPLRANWPLLNRPFLALSLALLGGCASTDLPPWPKQPVTPAQVSVARPEVQPGHVTSSSAPAQVSVQPVDSPQLQARNTSYNFTAVAERFPDLSIRYDTPGLREGRESFTTNAELRTWLESLAASPGNANVSASVEIPGHSPRGEPVLALVVAHAPGTGPADLRATRRPTVLLAGQQRGMDAASSEALLVMARELVQGLLEPMLEQINVIIVPRVNPDGAANASTTNAAGIDISLDHLHLHSPEAQALARLARDFETVVVMEVDEFEAAGRFVDEFGAVQAYDAMLLQAVSPNMPEFINKAAREWYFAPISQALQEQGLSTHWFFRASATPGERRLDMGSIQPDTLRNVNGIKNSISLKVASRGSDLGRAHIQRRVHTLVTALTQALQTTSARAVQLPQIRSYDERAIGSQACHGTLVTEVAATPHYTDMTFIDAQTGMDKTVRVDLDSATDLRVIHTIHRPCGYWLDASATLAVERLRLLGVQVLRVAEAGQMVTDGGDALRFAVTGASLPEAGISSLPQGQQVLDIVEGSFYITMAQPLANVAAAALEADASSSFLGGGVLNLPGQVARIVVPPSVILEEF